MAARCGVLEDGKIVASTTLYIRRDLEAAEKKTLETVHGRWILREGKNTINSSYSQTLSLLVPGLTQVDVRKSKITQELTAF